MPTQRPPRPETETPSQIAHAAADAATPTVDTRIPEWVRHFPTFPRLEGMIDEPAGATTPGRERSTAMQASVGDRLIVKSHRGGEPDRDALILEVRGPDGAPPYIVRWEEDGHEGFLFPGPDAVIHHFRHTTSPARG